jgi:hypothetical protein
MNLHKHFWSFKDKDQRRFENEQEKHRDELVNKDRAVEVAAHTKLDHIGRKGFLGLEHSMPAFFRHTRNLIYERWVRGRTKTVKYDAPVK